MTIEYIDSAALQTIEQSITIDQLIEKIYIVYNDVFNKDVNDKNKIKINSDYKNNNNKTE
jgi:hypothetical protein